MPQWARKGKYGREVSSSAAKSSKVSPSGIENKDRSHRSLKPVLLLFFKILLNLRKPSKPSFRPPFQTLDPMFAQQVAILPTRPDRSSVRSGSQRNIRTPPPPKPTAHQSATGVFQAAAGLVGPPPLPPLGWPRLAKNGEGGVWPKSRKMKKKRPHLGSLGVQAIPF